MIRYSTISLPKELYDGLQHMVETGSSLGYNSVADFCKEAIRLHVEEIKKELQADFLRKIDVPLLFKKIEHISAVDAGKYGEIFENLGVMVCMFSNDFKIKECNYEFVSALGYGTKNEILGKNLESLFIDEKLTKRIKHETLYGYEVKARRKDGKIIDTLLSVNPIKDKNYVAVAIDITVKNYLIDKEQKTRQLYEYLIDEICDTIMVIQDKKIKYVNKAVIATGWKREELINREIELLVAKEDREQAMKNYALAVQGADLGKPRIYHLLTPKNQIIKAELKSRKIMFDGRPALLVDIRHEKKC